MLTSIYYYDYYKPYILSSGSKPKANTKNRFNGINSKEYVQNSSKESSSAYLLNHADKNEIKSFILNISENVNGIKDTSRYLQNVSIGKNARQDEGKSAYGDGLEDFVSDYNSLVSFSENNNVSSEIRDFKDEVKKIVSDNEGALKETGVSADGDILEFDRSVYDSLTRESYKEKSSELNNAFAQVYSDAVDVLSIPMSNHLNFKNLDYYYSYRFGSKTSKSFQGLETGLIVDISL